VKAPFLTTSNNIWCIWYPSGGFGHFVNAVLSIHGQNFVRPKKTPKFDSNGNSHRLDLIAPKYYKNPDNYKFTFDSDKNYSVLIDNGINDESKIFEKFFPNAKIIKLCYSNFTWPIVARTIIEKAMNTSFDQELSVELNCWPKDELWAQREKYFLYLRDHYLRGYWKFDTHCQNIELQCFLNYQTMYDLLCQTGIIINNFEDLWFQWRTHNALYLDPVITARDIINAIRKQQDVELYNITDVWTQAVVYYYIWLHFQFEVPHNDYANWFTNVKEIVTMLDKHGVFIDSNS
jgi:hypothetical protein